MIKRESEIWYKKERISIGNSIKNKSANFLILWIGFALPLGFIMMELFDNLYLKNLIGWIIILYILISAPRLKGIIAVITYLMLFGSAFLIIGSDNKIEILIEGASMNLTLVTIFILTPLLGITVKTGDYINSLKIILIKKKNNVVFFYLTTMLLTHVLGIVINMGSVSINQHLTKVSNIKSSRLTSNALNRGFTTSIFWSPYFSAMALVISQLPIDWSDISLYLIGFSLLSMMVGFFLELPSIKEEKSRLNYFSEEKLKNIETGGEEQAKKKVKELGILVILIMISVLLLEKLTSFGMVMSISIVSLVFPLFWCLIKENYIDYKKELKQHFFSNVPNLKQEITLFLTAGLFSVIFVHSSLSAQLVQLLNALFGNSSLVMTFAIVLSIIISAVLGMHPIILVTIFIVSIDPMLIGFSYEYFAIILLASWGLSNTVSPATAVNNMLAKSLEERILTVSIKWNWQYAILMIVILPLYLSFFKL